MSTSRKTLCTVYGLIAVVALFGTWSQNLAYLQDGSFALAAFCNDMIANPASRSIAIDLSAFGIAVFIGMVLEARRLGMRGVWFYLAAGMLVAISVAVPAFLIHRELTLAKREPSV
jgi:uncharacterized membrane protein